MNLEEAKKIASNFIREIFSDGKKRSYFEFVAALTKQTKEQGEAFEQIEKEIGEDEANLWLVNIMVSTGLYIQDGEYVC